MTHLNDIKGFNWVSVGNNKEKYGKACIMKEAFWLRDCKQLNDGTWTAFIDNYLLETRHGLRFGMKVSFKTEPARR